MIANFVVFSIAFTAFALGYKTSVYESINSNTSDQLVVNTRYGKVLGVNYVTEDGNEFSYIGFTGIPYAKPPVDDLRFKPPSEPESWDGILDASQDAPACLQPFMSKTNNTMSEDCLYLNVYTPNLKGSYPVMVWIYGGFFLLGSASRSLYGPDYLIQEDVVVVTVNYRVGIFGFMSTEDAISPGNNGLKDQILALKWVQENIAAFGGDPTKVTLFGESAGSASVSVLLHAKPAKGLFRAAIMESGVSLSLFSRTRNPLYMAQKTAKLLNITSTSSDNADLVEKLRQVDARSLLSASLTEDLVVTSITNPSHGLQFAPTIETISNSEAVLSQLSHEQLRKGIFNNVPVIVGYNSAEGNGFGTALASIPLFMLRFDLNHKMLIPIDMNVNASSTKEVATQIKQFYFGNESINLQLEKVSQFISDDQFIRPTQEFVRLLNKFTQVFYYEFDYTSRGLNMTGKLPGVSHGDEVPYLWETGVSIAPEDQPTRRKLVKLWTNFAKYKNPTPEYDNELDNVLWNPSNSINFTYLKIKSSLELRTNPRKDTMDFWSAIYDKYGNPPYDTY